MLSLDQLPVPSQTWVVTPDTREGEGGEKEREGRAEAMGGQEGRMASNHELDESHKESLALLWEDSVMLTLNMV